MPSTSTWGRTEPFRYPTPHPPNPESGAHSPTRFGASSAKMHPTSLIPFDFRQDKWANPATRFGIGSAPRTEQRARQKMRYGSLTYDPSGRLCVRLLIRRSLVRAQVGEPTRYKSGHFQRGARFHLCHGEGECRPASGNLGLIACQPNLAHQTPQIFLAEAA